MIYITIHTSVLIIRNEFEYNGVSFRSLEKLIRHKMYYKFYFFFLIHYFQYIYFIIGQFEVFGVSSCDFHFLLFSSTLCENVLCFSIQKVRSPQKYLKRRKQFKVILKFRPISKCI